MPSVPSSTFSENMTPNSHNLLESNVDGISEEKKDESIERHLINSPSTSKCLGNLAKRPPLPPIVVNQTKRPSSRLHIVGNLNSITRSPSPSNSISSSLSYRARSATRSPSLTSSRAYSRLDCSTSLSVPPRRTFPRENSVSSLPNEDVASKEQAPVVFDASLNFVLGCDKQRVRQSFRPTASHLEPATASSYLSNRISQFLKRTDHIMDEWRSLGHKEDLDESCVSISNNTRNNSRAYMGRSQSATNIMIKGYQYFSRSSSMTKSPSSRRSISRASEDRTLSDGPGNEVPSNSPS